MSATSPQVPDFTRRLNANLLPLSLVLWGTYIGLLTAYCLLYKWVLSAEAPDVGGTAFWILREWWVWVLATPLVFLGFRLYSRRMGLVATYLWVGGLALLAMLALKVFQGRHAVEMEPAAVLVIYSIRYLATLAALTFFWHFFLRPRSPVAATAGTAAVSPARPIATETPQTLLVSKGSDKCLVRVDRIDCIDAAGNYVEIHSNGQTYLLRATMKQVEDMLPSGQFLRVHRSHIVNLDAIDRIRTRAAGNGTVHLRCGRVLSISRAVHARLKSTG